MFKPNEAGWDRALRVVVGLALLYLGWGHVVTGGLGTFFKIIGFLPVLTGVVGICPAYNLFKFATRRGG